MFKVVDLFAGPGGLAEGFSSVRDENGKRLSEIALSVEKESSAFETLRLRSFVRQFDRDLPDLAILDIILGEDVDAGFEQGMNAPLRGTGGS